MAGRSPVTDRHGSRAQRSDSRHGRRAPLVQHRQLARDGTDGTVAGSVRLCLPSSSGRQPSGHRPIPVTRSTGPSTPRSIPRSLAWTKRKARKCGASCSNACDPFPVPWRRAPLPSFHSATFRSHAASRATVHACVATSPARKESSSAPSTATSLARTTFVRSGLNALPGGSSRWPTNCPRAVSCLSSSTRRWPDDCCRTKARSAGGCSLPWTTTVKPATGRWRLFGLVAATRHDLFEREPEPHIYLPSGQVYVSTMHLHIRAADGTSPAGLVDAVRRGFAPPGRRFQSSP